MFKREFGECAHPINHADYTKFGTVDLGDSDEWQKLPAALPALAPQEGEQNAAFALERAFDKSVRGEEGEYAELCEKAELVAGSVSPSVAGFLRALVAAIRRLEGLLAQAEKDAKRYRWLRDRPSLIGWDWWVVKIPNDTLIDGEFMDAALAAALNSARKEGV